ncbi:MAG TPA: hypothetical protein PKJ41_09425 [Bryobacteraceae bacterium]|nr:hypothetical protein [Bryobacteraceae bacterium]HPT25417.1 hypothetical protein [Bryobacteraceae bacterium]
MDGPLQRLGEGIGKVVYASQHWVVKRERQPAEIMSLILIWKALRWIGRILPGKVGRDLLNRPSRYLRAIKVLVNALMYPIPRAVWMATHAGQVLRIYRSRDSRGEHLARTLLTGTPLVPETVSFPPTRVRVGGWPGWLLVSEATERVDCTLLDRLSDLAHARRFDEIEVWLDRFLDHRQAGWQRGLFSLDAHLKNFGVTSDRVVLLDPGGLTDNWDEIADRLGFEDEILRPHVQLGLEFTLRDRPDIAARFDRKWKETVTPERVRSRWPSTGAPEAA